jgi:TP901 family phage tail tape measure protein
MAENLISRLGFDAGGAINSINSLKSALDGLNTVLATTGKEIRSWNTGGGNASKAFDAMNKSAKGLLDQYKNLAQAQANITTGMGKGGGVLPQGGAESQLNLIQQLTSAWGTLPNTVSATTRQAFAGGIANAAQFATANKLSAQQVVQAFTTMGTGTTGAVAQLGTRLKALSTTHASATNQMKQGNQSLTLSFGTLIKVIQFRTAIAAIGLLTNKFTEGVKAGANFSRMLGMIQTVAGKGANLDKIKQDLVSLAREFAKPLPDVASAYYLVLQNQVGNATQSMNVLNEAMKLSVATDTSVTDAADTLTVALNGFGLSADSATLVAGKLFKAMEIGRFQFKDMSDVLGRVAPIAKDLGISLEEVLGPIATMTRQGVGFNTAVTQMRAIVSQTLKPTEELKRVFKGWGVENVEQAISKFGGFLPMLRALETELGGSSSALAKAFTNLRAFTGGMSILGQNYEAAIRDTQKIKDVTEEYSQAMYDMVAKTPGQEFAKITNQITTNFTQMGQSILPVLNGLFKAIESVTSVLAELGSPGTIAFLGTIATLMTPMIISFGTWLTSITACKIALSTLGPFAIIAFGAWLGVKLAGPINELIFAMRGVPIEARKMNQELLTLEKTYAEGVQKTTQKITDSKIESNRRFKEDITKTLTEVQQLQNKVLDDASKYNSALVGTVKTQLESIIGVQTSIVTKLQQTAQGGGQAMTSALNAYTKSAQSATDKEFGFRLAGMNDVQKAYAQMNRAQQQMNGAMRQLGSARTSEDFDAIKQNLEDAAKYAENASSSAASEGGNRALLSQTRNKELSIANAITNVDRQRIRLLQQQQQMAPKTFATETKRLEEMKLAVNDILEGTKQFTGEGAARAPKTGTQMAEDFKKAQIAWVQLQKLMGEGGKNLSLLGVGKLQEQLAGMAGKLPALQTQVKLDYKASYDQMTAFFAAMPIPIKLAFPDLDPVNPLPDLTNKMAANVAEMDTLLPKINSYNAAIQTLQYTMFTRVTQPFGNVLPNIDVLSQTTTGTNELSQAYNRMLLSIQALTKVDPTSIKAFQQALGQASTSIQQYDTAAAKNPIQNKLVDPSSVQAMKDAFTQINQQFQNLAPGLEIKVKYDQLIAANDTIRQMGVGIQIPVTLVGTSANDIALIAMSTPTIKTNLEATNIAMTTLTPSAQAFATAMQAAATASQQIRIPSVPIVNQARGGLMRLAAGGSIFKSHGTDTIPAMLSPGEFVVNARSTRRFFSQLVAMNAGAQPLYRQDGGAVTNIGDINVSVNGSTSTRQTAREIATALRREVRRGTSKL